MLWWNDADSARLKRIERKVDRLMATFEELSAALADISAEIDKVSADTDNLLAQLANIPTPGMTPEQQAALDTAVASANALKARLTDLDAKVPDPSPPAA